MGQVLEIEGRTIDEAIFAGLEQMGLSFDEVDIETIQDSSKGFLGIGRTNARVRLTQREKSAWDEPQKPAGESSASQAEAAASRETAPKPARSGSAEPRRREKSDRARGGIDTAPVVKKEITGQPVDAGEPAVAFIAGLLDAMGIKGEARALSNEEGMYIDISGEDMGRIIGYRGETLDAMQYLASMVENKGKDGYTRITVDTENYRAKREQTLVRLGRRLADKALRTGRNVALEPMNPYERRIIHSALQEVNGVTTVSRGEEPNRHIIIEPERR